MTLRERYGLNAEHSKHELGKDSPQAERGVSA